MNMVKIVKSAFMALLALSAISQASITYEGSIEQLSYDSSDINQDTVSVDYWEFTVNSTGKVSIDVLSWEKDPDEWFWVDVNGDGEDSFIDSYVYVFKDSLHADNLYASNDDSSLAMGGSDGSIRGNDSFITTNDFEAGNYIIAISSCGYPSDYFTVAEAIDGVNQKAIIPYSEGVGDWGDYRIAITGDVTAVPEPATLCLLACGAVSLLRRRKSA